MRLRSIFRRGRIEAEMREEMALHLAFASERFMAGGMPEDEARRAARREFGNVPHHQEEAREARGVLWIESLLADIRFALRTFRRTPFATATIVGILALGLGVNTALFTIVHSVLNLPAPGIEQDDSLVRIRRYQVRPDPPQYGSQIQTLPFSYPEVREIEGRGNLFNGVAAWGGGGGYLTLDGDEPSRIEVRIQFVTQSYFEALNVRLALGPGFLSGEVGGSDAPSSALVVDHATWDRYLGQDPNVIGKVARIDEITFKISGVAPPLFKGVDGGIEDAPTVWVPLDTRFLFDDPLRERFAGPELSWLNVVARLHDGVDPASAALAIESIARRVNETRAKPWAGEARVDAVILTASNREVGNRGSVYIEGSGTADSPGPFLLLTTLLLAIVCLNVGALLAALALTRQREIVVRLALGASRPRIVRQLLTESAFRTIAGGMVGAWIVWISLPLIDNVFPGVSIALSWEMILLTFGFALATGVLLGLLPALHATRISVSDSLKNTAASIAGRRSKLPRVFVVSQIALTLPAIAVLSAFLIWGASMWEPTTSSEIDRQVVLADFHIGDLEANEAMPALRERLDATAGIVRSTIRTRSGSRLTLSIHQDDRIDGVTPESSIEAVTTFAGPGYFEVMNLPVILGRDFLAAERDTANVFSAVVVRGDVAHQLWGDANPIGRRLIESDTSNTSVTRELTVVGVVSESQMASATRRSYESSEDLVPLYVPSTPYTPNELLIRTQGDATPLLPSIRSVISEGVSAGTLQELQTLSAIRREAIIEVLRIVGAMVGAVALGLLLCAIGLYGVIAVAGGHRVREIGVRTVMGATPRGVRRLILKEGARLGTLGILFGLPPGLGLLYYMASQHVDSPPYWTHLPAALLTAFLVLATALLASWLPARKAAAVDPMTVLRVE